MIFGFVATAIAGFLLTAVPNWTDTPRLQGRPLAALVAVWLAGRLALWLAAWLPGAAVTAIDLLFVPLLAGAVGRPIWRRRLRRNYPVAGVLGLLTLANAVVHAGVLGGSPLLARRGLYLALYAVLGLLAIISGRIVPLFTRNALLRRGLDVAVESRTAVEWSLALVMAAAIGLTLFAEGSRPAGVASLACSALLVVRQARWQPARVLDQPILWVLHAGHAWLAIGFLCQGISALSPSFPASTALHALGAGAIGTSIIAVMSRVSLGHTGRELEASRSVAIAYVLVIAAGAVRVFAPLAFPTAYRSTVVAAGCLWAAGYGLFAVSNATLLTRPRVDGRPG